MLSAALIAGGAALMLFGALMIAGWIGGKSTWFDAGIFDRQGATKTDRQFLSLYFFTFVIAPLMVGAMLIIFGLQRLE